MAEKEKDQNNSIHKHKKENWRLSNTTPNENRIWSHVFCKGIYSLFLMRYNHATYGE